VLVTVVPCECVCACVCVRVRDCLPEEFAPDIIEVVSPEKKMNQKQGTSIGCSALMAL
jgi:hypothetical protein